MSSIREAENLNTGSIQEQSLSERSKKGKAEAGS